MGYNAGMDARWRHGALRPARDRAVLVLRLAVLLAPGAHALSSCSFYIFFGLMLFTQVITNISYVLGPVAQFHENSRFYSAVAPKPNPEVDNRLPHITIQMPVYKESLKETMCVFFPFLSFLSFLSWGYSCYQRGFGRALAFMLTTAGISAPEGICAGSPFRLWAWAARSRLRRYSGPGTRLGGLSNLDVSMRSCLFLSCQWRRMECRCEMEIRRRCLSGLLLRRSET